MSEITDKERIDFFDENGLEIKHHNDKSCIFNDKSCIFYGGLIVGSGKNLRDAIDMAIRSKNSILQEVS